ncbi:MAG: phospholipid carrier-dependent glycosyltransferase [Candidatus Pristimantibacillus lignocellulolyticus]|uniref:Polyprenol-phosphate-mannose--protein mannosyltransferase n=1 Tax=Candidatus Pristimantibacillus lignocellulolyticus TaxID=2994561 RepID=A0A9J6ZEJ3_9BACL|nr:MAG: phospholipid carrier-dependent glycosyltransferase [Candidatus Pristimantibacillus lignocellulolyticus]
MSDLRMNFTNHSWVRLLLLISLIGFGLFVATPVFAAEAEADPKISILKPLIAIGLFCIMSAVVHQIWFRDHKLLEKKFILKKTPLIWTSILIGLAIRLWLAATNSGYVNDLALFHYWGNYAYSAGMLEFYHGDFFVDYPPGYIYVLYIVAWLGDLLNIDYGSMGFLILYKLPAIIADVIASLLIFKLANKKLSMPISLGLMLIYWFNPVVLIDGAVWGQVDSIFALVLVISIAFFMDKRIAAASVTFAIAALIKPQAFIFMPIVLLALWYGRSWKNVMISAAYGFGTFLLLALPLFLKGDGLNQLIDLYKGTLSSYAYGSLNAFNLYSLFGYNWIELDEKMLGITLEIWGYVGIALAVFYAGWLGLRSKVKLEQLYFIAASLIGIVFILVTKMHERYMFVIIVLLIMAFVQHQDRRLLHLVYGFTITNTLNLYDALAFSPMTTFVPNDGVAILSAAGNVILLIYMLYIGVDLFIKKRTLNVDARDAQLKLQHAAEIVTSDVLDTDEIQPPRRWYDIGMKRKDWIIVAIVTLIYGIIAFINLGDMKSPKTVWEPTVVGESVIFDLGTSQPIERITSFGGVGSGEYSYSFANELGQWSNEVVVTHDHVAVFAWHEENIMQDVTYVKLTATKLGFRLHELGVYVQGSQEPAPMTIIENTNSDSKASHLIDEQQLSQYHHTYKHGSYFDEVYHARTAYENIEGIQAYESTHPPLGKILIALGIQLFGFGPFGWRFMGTLFGVLMLPVIYFMAKAILRKTVYAAGAIILLAVDFMHFTQTRIATIDVYAVFFIMLMFFFMNQYATLNFYRERLRSTWIPLGLAGLCFGLGVASKWIVLYGGAGLAIMLAIVLWRRYQQYRAAKLLLEEGKNLKVEYIAQLTTMKQKFVPYTVYTLLICILFYIGVPALIYALSNIPVLTALPSGYTWQALVDYQVNMYNYHSNLVSSHPFSSTWWEWPFMKRPVWYYVDSEIATGLRSTIVALGNPIIWWSGIFAMIATIFISIRKKEYMAMMLFIAYGSQYIPWMLVPRETFLYHYFAMVPFIVLSIMYIAKYIEEKNRMRKIGRNVIIAIAIFLFILFYPALSGAVVSEQFVNDYLRWFPSWLF